MRNWIRGALVGVSEAALAGIEIAQQGPQTAPQPAAPAVRGAAPAVRGAAPASVAPGATEVMAEMRDKVKLAGNLYLPAGAGPFPCIVQRTPYGKDAMFASPAGAKKYVDAGYA